MGTTLCGQIVFEGSLHAGLDCGAAIDERHDRIEVGEAHRVRGARAGSPANATNLRPCNGPVVPLLDGRCDPSAVATVECAHALASVMAGMLRSFEFSVALSRGRSESIG